MYVIDRCICKQITFAEMVELARAEDLTAEDVARRTGVGLNCQLCVAYLKRALATGQTRFQELLPMETLDVGDASDTSDDVSDREQSACATPRSVDPSRPRHDDG